MPQRNRQDAHSFRPLKIGRQIMKNRLVMGPLTRCRADDHHTPTELMTQYYGSRASMGLIVTESTMVQRDYSSFAYEPGIYTAQQVEGWKRVTADVHSRGGLIYCQLYHGGRVVLPCNAIQGDKLIPVGASSHGVPPEAEICPAEWSRDHTSQPYPQTVHALKLRGIANTIQTFAHAAKNAMLAGFDGVEIHAGGGYLIDQFLRESSNARTDGYGGSIENRARFLLEVVDAVAEAIGADCIGVRLTPLDSFNGQSDSNPEALTRHVCRSLEDRRVAYIHIVRGDPKTGVVGDAAIWAREEFEGSLIASHGYSPADAEKAIADGAVDAVSFGLLCIANPDLPWRIMSNASMNRADPATFCSRGPRGYIDYEVIEPQATALARVRCPSVTSRENSQTVVPHRQSSTSAPLSPTNTQPAVRELLRPLLLGRKTLKNRLVVGPLPRQRCSTLQQPTPMVRDYYADRALCGLIISEPCEVQPGYNTYVGGAAISTRGQVEAWRVVTDAVHERGGLMYCQLHHGGRAVLPCNLTDPEMRVMGPTENGIPSTALCPAAFAADGRAQPYASQVVAVRRTKLQWLVHAYTTAAKNAMLAGFDGVEIHAGGGYLIDQFLRESSNARTDGYGGSIENRARFLLEVVDAVAEAIGADCIGVRVSPTDLSKGMQTLDSETLTAFVASEMNARRIAYIAVASGSDGFFHGPVPAQVLAAIRTNFAYVLLSDDNADLQVAESRVAAEEIDAVCMTLPAVSNPDLVDRALRGVELAPPDMKTIFSHGAEGYNTYTTYAAEKRKAWAMMLEASATAEGSTNIVEAPHGSNDHFSPANHARISTKEVIMIRRSFRATPEDI